jgi:hypothetical protein
MSTLDTPAVIAVTKGWFEGLKAFWATQIGQITDEFNFIYNPIYNLLESQAWDSLRICKSD